MNARPRDAAPGRVAPWIGLLGAPAVFFSHLQLAYVLVPRACRYHADVWLHVVGVASVVLAAAAMAVAWRVWTSTDHAASDEDFGAVPRARFMGVTGLGMSALFVLLLLAQWIAAFFISPCQ